MDDKNKSKKQLISELESLRAQLDALQDSEAKHKQAEDLQGIKERYALVMSTGRVGTWDWNRETNEIYLDSSLKAAIGYTDDEIRNHLDELSKHIHPDDVERVKAETEAYLAGEQPFFEVEHRMLHKDGSVRWFLARGTVVRDADGNPSRVVGTGADITEHKLAGEALRESERKYRLLAEHARDVIWMLDIETRRFTYMSPSVEDLSGYSVEEALAKTLEEILTPASFEIASQTIEEELAIERMEHKDLHRARTLELEFIRKDGSTAWIENRVTLLRDAEERFVGALGVTRDITEHKLAEEALRESERKYRLLAEHVRDVIWTLDIETRRFTYMSPSVEDLGGYSVEEALDKTLEEILTPSSFEIAIQIIEEEMAIEHTEHEDLHRAWTVELEFIRKDGSTVWIENRITLLRDAEEQLIGALGVTRDISERKLAGEALRASEEMFRSLVEQSEDGIVLVDEQGMVVEWNRGQERISGLKREEALGRPFADIQFGLAVEERQTPEAHREIKARLLDFLETGEAPWLGQLIEREIQRVDGTHRIVQTLTFPIKTGKGTMLGSIVRDITEHRQTKEALWESEARHRQLFDGIADICYVIDREWRYTHVNQAASRVTRKGEGELIGRSIHDIFPGVENSTHFIAYQQVMETGQPQRFTADRILPDGLPGVYEVRVYPVPEGILCIAHDITERTRMERAEREQRVLAEALRDTASVLNSTLDFDEVLHRILSNVGRVVPHDAATIMLIEDEEAYVVRHRGYAERGSAEFVSNLRLRVDEVPSLSRMIETRQPLVVPDVRKYLGWKELKSLAWVRSYAGSPILLEGEVVGFLCLDSDRPGFFSPEQAERLQAFADQAAIAVANARMYQELEQRVEERTAELREAHERLLVLANMKNDFIANISHELRTPLANLKLYHHLLSIQPEKTASYLATLRRESRRLEHIVEDLLIASQWDQERPALEVIPVDLNALAGQYVADRVPQAEERGLELTFNREADLPPVQGDPILLERALSVLVANALGYTPEGGQVRVSTGGERREGKQWAYMRVADTGPGVPPDELPRIFERFFRGKVGLESGMPGTGLGLAIAQEIAEQHSGRVEAANEGAAGRGATFTIWLPVEGADGGSNTLT